MPIRQLLMAVEVKAYYSSLDKCEKQCFPNTDIAEILHRLLPGHQEKPKAGMGWN
jgi:hypothetical protein